MGASISHLDNRNQQIWYTWSQNASVCEVYLNSTEGGWSFSHSSWKTFQKSCGFTCQQEAWKGKSVRVLRRKKRKILAESSQTRDETAPNTKACLWLTLSFFWIGRPTTTKRNTDCYLQYCLSSVLRSLTLVFEVLNALCKIKKINKTLKVQCSWKENGSLEVQCTKSY